MLRAAKVRFEPKSTAVTGCPEAVGAPFSRPLQQECRSVPILSAFHHRRAGSCRRCDNNFRRAATEAIHNACGNHHPNTHLRYIFHQYGNFSLLDRVGRREGSSLPTLVDNGPHWIVHAPLIAQPEKGQAKLRSRKKCSSSNSPILVDALMRLKTVLFNNT